MLVYIIVLLVFAGAASLAAYVLAPNEEQVLMRMRVRELRLAATDPDAVVDAELSQPLTRRLLAPMAENLHRALLGRTPQGMRDAIRARLREAGDPMGVGSYLALRLYAAALVGLVLILLAGPSLSRQWGWPGTLALGFFGGYSASVIPSFWLGRVIAARKKAIQDALPDVLDLLCVSVEAGLGLDGAIQKVTERLPGPLADELGHTLKEVNLGKTREEAWRNLAARANVPDLNVVVSALLQAEKLGASISTVLRVQAEDMRERRRQRAEEKARQIPIKLLFPLIFFVFPALFVVILGPGAIQIMRTIMR